MRERRQTTYFNIVGQVFLTLRFITPKIPDRNAENNKSSSELRNSKN